MKKFLVISIVSFFIIITFLNTANAITVSENALISNINIINSILQNTMDTSNPSKMTEIVDENGNVPAYKYYPNTISSKSIKTLKAYDGKIFMGLGDWNSNTGPTKVIYYDTLDGKIKSSGTINDDAIENFKIIDGTLYTTGCDPKDDWGYGSFYTYNKETNTWEQHLNNGGWIHVFNIAKLKNNLYICGSTEETYKASQIQVSNDNGNTFKSIPIYKNNKLLPYNGNLRCYNLVVYKNKLYGYIYYSPYSGFYEYDETNNRFDYISSHPYKGLVGGISEFNVRNLEYEIFKDTFIFVSGSGSIIYTSNDLKTFQNAKTNIKGNIRDLVVHNDTLYVLSLETNRITGSALIQSKETARIYSSKDLTNFNLIYEFTIDGHSPASPFSLEYYDNNLYIGTSAINGEYENVGRLFKLNLANNKRTLSIDTKNKEIKISDNSQNYAVKYDLQPTKTVFETTLCFNNSMNREQCKNEYSKINNMSLLYTSVIDGKNINFNDSTAYFNDICSKNIKSNLTSYKTAIEFAQNLFKNELNIQDKHFTLTTSKISESKDEYSTILRLSITTNNSDDNNNNNGDNNGNTDNNITNSNTNGNIDNNITNGNTNSNIDNNITNGNTNGNIDNNITNSNTNVNIDNNINNGNNNGNNNSNNNNNSGNDYINNNNKLPQSGNFFKFKNLLYLIIIIAIIIITILFIKENKYKKSKKE